MKLQNHSESDGDLGGGHGDDEEKHHLTIHLPPTGAGGDKSQTAGIEHNFHAHQRENEITPREKSGQPQQKQHCREKQRVIHWYRCHEFPPLW
jgi:hypothetical protein